MSVATNDMNPEQLLSAAYLFGLSDADYRGIAKHDLGEGHVVLTAYVGNTEGQRFLELMVERGWARRVDDAETEHARC
jgi:hypothetical protein